MTDLLLSPNYLKQEIQKQRALSQDELETIDEQLAAIRAAIADTNRKIGILLDQMLDNEFPQAIIDERRRLLTDKLHQLQTEEERIHAQQASAIITDDQEQTLIQLATAIRQGLEHTNFEQKQQILRILRIRVDVIDKRRVKLSGYIPFQQDILDLELGTFVDLSSSCEGLQGLAKLYLHVHCLRFCHG
ncbi:hypothetical protein KFU94_43370 [Chloroflexi bacterium TSY]|nr:hypothetical protein [Chloroflexi bacterium TSY]